MPLRVCLVSAVPWSRAGLRAVFEGLADVEIVGEAETLDSIPDALRPSIDVVVLESEAAEDVDWTATDLAGAHGPGVVVLGEVGPRPTPSVTSPGRAWASLSRHARADQIVAAVRAVGAGLVALEPASAVRTLESVSTSDASAPMGEELTGRERQVLELVALGLPNKTIGQRLAISEHTVKFHVASIMAKLGAASRTEAVHLAARRGLVAL